MSNSVKVIFFGSLSDSVTETEQIFDLQSTQTAEAVFEAIATLNPALNAVRENTHIKVAINKEFSNWEAEVTSGDELAFFPPVTGG